MTAAAGHNKGGALIEAAFHRALEIATLTGDADGDHHLYENIAAQIGAVASATSGEPNFIYLTHMTLKKYRRWRMLHPSQTALLPNHPPKISLIGLGDE